MTPEKEQTFVGVGLVLIVVLVFTLFVVVVVNDLISETTYHIETVVEKKFDSETGKWYLITPNFQVLVSDIIYHVTYVNDEIVVRKVTYNLTGKADTYYHGIRR